MIPIQRHHDRPRAIPRQRRGIALLLGALIVTRPLTSLVLLTVYVGLSALIFGLVQFAAPHQERGWAARIFAALWVVLGLAMLLGLGRTLELLPVALALLLLVLLVLQHGPVEDEVVLVALLVMDGQHCPLAGPPVEATQLRRYSHTCT